MPFIQRALTLAALLPTFACAGGTGGASILDEALANGISFAQPVEVRCQFKAEQPEQVTPELKAALVRAGFDFKIHMTMDEKSRVTGLSMEALHKGIVDAQWLTSTVQQTEALTQGKPGSLSWSVSQARALR